MTYRSTYYKLPPRHPIPPSNRKYAISDVPSTGDTFRNREEGARATIEPLSSAIIRCWVQRVRQKSGLELLIGGGRLERSVFRVLVVDDYEPWRAFVAATLKEKSELRIIGEASDGLEAVQVAQQLQPDLILMDIGLPTLNGIEAARRIRQISPKSRILFVSENRSRDIAEEVLRLGACGYVVKSAAVSELLPAVEAVLEDRQFVSVSLTGPGQGDLENELNAHNSGGEKVSTRTPPLSVETVHHHEVGFYSDQGSLLDDVTQFIGAALMAGNAAIVVATESHRDSLLSRLQAQGVDIGAAIEQGRYIALDATDTLSTFVVDDTLDSVRFMETFGNLIATARNAANGEHPRVAVFGEGAHLLWTQGNVHAAIQDEKLCNELSKIYEVDFLCGYSVGSVQGRMDTHVFEQICAQHSAVYSR